MRDAHSPVAGPISRDVSLAESFRTLFRELPSSPRPFGIALAVFVGTLGFTLLAKDVVGVDVVDTIFLLAIAAVAIRCGPWPSLAFAAVSALAYDFFFVPPLYAPKAIRPENVATLSVYLLAAVIASHLAARIRAETLAARQCAATAEALYAYSQRIATITDLDELLQATVQQIATMLDLEAVLLLPDATGKLTIRASTRSWRDIDLSGGGDPGARHAGNVRFLDLRTNDAVVGRVGLARRATHKARHESLLTGEQQKTLDTLLSQAAVAIERILLGRERDEARLAAETERLRAALLTSLSHDLKTPLASILGAITALRQDRDLYGEMARDELESMIQDEAERLSRFVANLLHMTRLEAGAIIPDRQPVDLGEVIGSAVRQAAPVLGSHPLKVDLDPGLPLLDLEAGLLEHVLVNLLDNAATYAPAASPITLRARQEPEGVSVAVADEGPGLPPGDPEQVFEMFRRVSGRERPAPGTGLGLAICRGFVEALGGRIRAANRADGPGAVFTITFPEALISAAEADGS